MTQVFSDSGFAAQSMCRYVYTQTLLDLGASPNYKDDRGLTPLYHAVMKNSDAGPQCVQMLLFNRSEVGAVDDIWNTELHQVSNSRILPAACYARPGYVTTESV